MFAILIACACACAAPALAQPQTVVVPAGSAVVIAPRGQAMPRPSMAPATRSQRRVVLASPSGDTLTGPSAAVAVGLAGAAAMAVIFGGGSSGGGSGGSSTAAPARTR